MKNIAGFLLLILVNTYAYSQDCKNELKVPKELTWNRYHEFGEVDRHPFTMFNKDEPNWSLENEINKIRSRIIKSPVARNHPSDSNGRFQVTDPVALYYRDCYHYLSINPEPGICNKEGNCEHAMWVKRNAFIALIGLKYFVYAGVRDSFSILPDSARTEYARKAENGLKNLNPRVSNCDFGFDCSEVHTKAFDLMQYLQAYDMLKATGDIGQDYNLNDCNPRNKLRQFAANMYRNADPIINSSSGWKKNHGIICASVLGMAAILPQPYFYILF